MSAPHVFAPRRLPNAVLIEIVLRLLLAGFLIWQGFASGEALVAALCGLAACYHVAVALRMASWRIASLTRLTLDPWGLTWREIGRDRRYGWAQVHATHATEDRKAARRPGVLVSTGDAKGVTGHFLLPDVFADHRFVLAAEIERLRGL